LDGAAEYGVGTTELLLRREKGVPVVVLAAIFQHSPLALLAPKHEGIQSLHDLAGHQVMIEPGSAELYGYLKREGIPPDRLSNQPHDFDMKNLTDGKVAAMSVYVTDELFNLRRPGMDFQLYSPRSGGIDFYGDNLFTTEAEIRSNPERVKAFREASLRGWEYAMSHVEEIVELIHLRYGQRHSLEHLRFEAKQMAPLLQVGLVETGHMYAGRWQHIADVYAELGMMRPNFDLKGFLYDPIPPPPDLHWLYWILGGLGTLLVVAGGMALALHRANLRLRQSKQIAERSLDEQRQFLSMVSHEFRSPLATIDSSSQVLGAICGECKHAPVVQRIRRAVKRLSLFLDNCLMAGRLDTRSWALHLENMDLPSFLLAAVEYAALTPSSHSVNLVQGDLPEHFQGDPGLLRIMLNNLLENAIKYSPPAIPVTLRAHAGKKGWLTLVVEDAGIGILPEEREQIFSRYFRGRQVGNVPGAGLGLHLVHHVVMLHGGEIDVASEPGRGTTVTVRLPVHGGTS
jgi:signal transduction histidine kinase